MPEHRIAFFPKALSDNRQILKTGIRLISKAKAKSMWVGFGVGYFSTLLAYPSRGYSFLPGIYFLYQWRFAEFRASATSRVLYFWL